MDYIAEALKWYEKECTEDWEKADQQYDELLAYVRELQGWVGSPRWLQANRPKWMQPDAVSGCIQCGCEKMELEENSGGSICPDCGGQNTGT